MEKKIIGRAERISLPSLNVSGVPAKIDTGADSSSIWCSHIKLVGGKLECVFFGEESEYYTGRIYTFKKGEFDITRISNSFGRKEIRYKLQLPIKVRGRLIKATFTLADRSSKLYPVLIGRSTLRGKFLVDAAKGRPLKDEERKRKELLLRQMAQHRKEMGL